MDLLLDPVWIVPFHLPKQGLVACGMVTAAPSPAAYGLNA